MPGLPLRRPRRGGRPGRLTAEAGDARGSARAAAEGGRGAEGLGLELSQGEAAPGSAKPPAGPAACGLGLVTCLEVSALPVVSGLPSPVS